MFYYAHTLQNEIKRPVDKRDVIKYYKLAIDKGYNDEIKSYAGCLFNGYGVPKDKKEAARYYKIAADKGDKDSLSMYNKIKSELDNESSPNGFGGKSINILAQNESKNYNSNVPKQQEPTNPPKFYNLNERSGRKVYTFSPDMIHDLEPLDTNDTNNEVGFKSLLRKMLSLLIMVQYGVKQVLLVMNIQDQYSQQLSAILNF